MKKVGVFLLGLACVCASCLTKVEPNPLYDLLNEGRVCYVAKTEFEGAQVVQCGDLFFNYFSVDCADESLEEKSIAVQFEGNFDLNELLSVLDATIVSLSEQEEFSILCIWTRFGGECFVVNGCQANCQIAVKEDEIVVGFPAIYTAF